MLPPSLLSPQARAWKGLRHDELEDTVLATIINAKVERLQRDNSGQTAAIQPPPPRPRRSLCAAVAKPGRSFILECKQASPSLGNFCPDFNLDALISAYAHYANAVSVVCEEDFFRGSLTYLTYVRQHLELPLLCKDFIICPEQIAAAAAAGADAVLLMLSVLEPQYFSELYSCACKHGLEVLTEVSTRAEAETARECGVPLVGINNRNLRSLSIDFTVTQELAPLFKRPTLVISESGIRTHHDLLELQGVDGYLIGSALCADIGNLSFNLKGLLYGFNKICGIRDRQVLECAITNELCFAGFIFYPGSPRYISIDEARKLIVESACQGRIKTVGVFVDEPLESLSLALASLPLDYVQLHGTESPAYIQELRTRCPGVGIIKAVAVTDESSLQACDRYAALCDYLLLDNARAGHGQSFNHALLHGYRYGPRTLLGGGIGSDNFSAAFTWGLCGVDLNSSLERTRGVKDCALIDTVMAAINAC